MRSSVSSIFAAAFITGVPASFAFHEGDGTWTPVGDVMLTDPGEGAKLEQDGVFDGAMKRTNYGPDVAYTRIQLRRAAHQLDAASWHELYEQNGGH